MGERDLLFVYGTLMRGERSAHLLGDARLVRRTRTAARYWLALIGADSEARLEGTYPALVEQGRDAVAGELYEVDVAIFPVLDAFEDVPRLYQRVRIDLDAHRPWVYLMRARDATGQPRIVSGDWRKR